MSSRIVIRTEREEDADAVRKVNIAAFPSTAEADLVDTLRAAGLTPWVSLVAQARGRVAGHILFTPVNVVGDGVWQAMALGPMAVLPSHQSGGIGGKLVQAGLKELAALGQNVVFVLGHPGYYPRFGFRPTGPLGITSEFGVPEPVFMVAELRTGALGGRRGEVHYHEKFKSV